MEKIIKEGKSIEAALSALMEETMKKSIMKAQHLNKIRVM